MAKKPSKKTAKAPKKSGGAMEADSNDEKTGLKLGTVVTLVSFHDEENESLRYDAKANADMCSVLEAFFGVEKSAWDNFADLPTNNEEPYRRFPGGLQPYRDWKAAVVVGDKVEVRKSDCWYEGIVRNIIPGFSQWSGPRYEVALEPGGWRTITGNSYSTALAPPGTFIGNWRDDLEAGVRVEAQRDDDTWAMTRIKSVAADVLELTVVGSDDETLSLERESPRLARPGTFCTSKDEAGLKALELMGNPRDVLKRMLHGYLANKDPRRCHSGEIERLVAKCESQKDVYDMLAELGEEFNDDNFELPPLPDIEPVKLELDEDGDLTHAESGLSTASSRYSYGYGGGEVAAVLGSSRHGGLGKVIEITATLGHAGLNWTPKRHATVSPPLAERIKTTLLCSVADRKKPHAEKTLALLPNRILIHNVMSFLADVHTTRINDQLMVDETPPNGTYYTDEFKPKGSSLIGFMAPAVEVHIPVSLDVTLKPDWLDVLDGDSSNSWRSRSRRQQLSTLLSTMAGSGDDASAHVQEVVQPSILAGTPWAGPTTPPAKLSHAAPHLAILEAARPSATAPMHASPKEMACTLRPYQRRALAWICVEINQCVGCTRQFFTKSFLGDDAAVLARSSGEEFTPPRRRAGVASMAWRTTRRFSTNAP